MFLKILQSSQENTGAKLSFLMKLLFGKDSGKGACEFCEIFKSNFLQRTPRMAASERKLRSLWSVKIGDHLICKSQKRMTVYKKTDE